MIKAVRNVRNRIVPTTSSQTHTGCLGDTNITTVYSLLRIDRRTQSYTVAIVEQNVVYGDVAMVVFSPYTFKNYLIACPAGYCHLCFAPDIALQSRKKW